MLKYKTSKLIYQLPNMIERFALYLLQYMRFMNKHSVSSNKSHERDVKDVLSRLR